MLLYYNRMFLRGTEDFTKFVMNLKIKHVLINHADYKISKTEKCEKVDDTAFKSDNFMLINFIIYKF